MAETVPEVEEYLEEREPRHRVLDDAVLREPISILNPAALEAAKGARFRPWQASELVDAVWVRIPLRFSIGEHRPPSGSPPVPGAGGLAAAHDQEPFERGQGHQIGK